MWVYVLQGKGTEDDPYLINDADDLAGIHLNMVESKYTYFRQTQDIDCSSLTSYTPANTRNAAYGIMYDGGNRKIMNFSCSVEKWPSIFGVIHGTVKNLIVENPSVSAVGDAGIVGAWLGNIDNTLEGRIENVHVIGGHIAITDQGRLGGLIGRSGSGTIVNCSFDGVVERTTSSTNTSNYPLGGILGEALKNVTITGCHTSGEIQSRSRYVSGGILGMNDKNAITITNCSSSMRIYSKVGYAGGIIGLSQENLTVSDCYSTGDITCEGSYASGIVGYAKKTATISRCYSTGNITAKKYSAGVLSMSVGPTKVSDCYSTGDIAAKGDSNSSHVGGVVANTSSDFTIVNCFATGSVSGTYALGGVVAHVAGNQASGDFTPELDVNSTVKCCIAFNSSIKTITSGGQNPSSRYSGGAVVGFTSPKNTLSNCWRSPDMTFNYYKDTSLNVLTDEPDSSPTNPQVQPSGAAKWYRPYDGKAASAGATVSSVAKEIGWSESTWDLSGPVPSLRSLSAL